MADVYGQETEPERGRELEGLAGRPYRMFTRRGLTGAVMGVAASVAVLMSAMTSAAGPAISSPSLLSATSTAHTGAGRSAGADAAATPPAATAGPANLHVVPSSGGPSTPGRGFSYGFDLAYSVPTWTNLPTVQSTIQAARTGPGTFVDVPIMGWGPGNPEPSPGVYDFSGIAKQLAFVQATGDIPFITLCAAPDWMKGGQAGTTDWSQINVAPVPQHYQDFATLSAAVARAFPQVKHFVVWNEMKGFVNPVTGTDSADYTAMYNDVYRAVKSVRPDALVGGPYVSVRSLAGPPSPPAPSPSGPWGHVVPDSLAAISYWLTHNVGADFIAVDGRAYTNDAGLTTDPLTSTGKYAAVDRWLASQTSLPIVWMESHLLPDPTVATVAQQAALRVAALLQMASSGASIGMQWNPVDQPTWDEGVWSSPWLPAGGRATILGQELPGVLAVLAGPVSLVPGEPAGTLVATGPDGTVTVTVSGSSATVVSTGPHA